MNLAQRLLRVGETDAIALRHEDATRTYGDLRALVAARAGALARFVEPGARVAIIGTNHPHFVETYLAILWAGAVAVPLEPSAPEPELARQIAAVDPSCIVLAGGATLAADVATSCPRYVTADDVDPSASPLTDPVNRGGDDLAALMFTSGTAGSPKAAMLTHGSLAANLDSNERDPALRLGPDDVVLGVIPFFHVFGLNVVIGRTLDAGAELAIVEHFDPAATLALVPRVGITVVLGVPAIYAAWLALPDADPQAFATVRMAASGATFLPESTVAAMQERFGVPVHEGYGLTEASPVVTSAIREGPALAGSVGRPVPGVEVRIVDADGSDTLAGDPGEILVRGPNVFAGYWNEPEATAAVLRDGWLHTGDIGVVGADGELRLVDRVKDLIIVSGFNVYPGEVEAALAEHPDVASAAVVGVADRRSGEAVEAYVVPVAGAKPSESELVELVEDRLARYKVPRAVHFVDDLPRNWGGKVLRRALEHG